LHWVGRLCSDDFFPVVLSWLSGFLCGGFAVFSYVLWWLGGFSNVLSWLGGFFCGSLVFFLLLMALALQPLVFSAFLDVIRD
jgi:hypothetical protein